MNRRKRSEVIRSIVIWKPSPDRCTFSVTLNTVVHTMPAYIKTISIMIELSHILLPMSVTAHSVFILETTRHMTAAVRLWFLRMCFSYDRISWDFVQLKLLGRERYGVYMTHSVSFWASALARADLYSASRSFNFLASKAECLRAKGGSRSGPENLRRIALLVLGWSSSGLEIREFLRLWEEENSCWSA